MSETPANPPTVLSADDALKLAQSNARAGQFAEADRIYAILTQHFPGNALLHHERGRVAQRASNHQQALEHYAQAARLDRTLHAARESLGTLLHRHLPQVQPPTPATLDDEPDDAFVYVVSSSHARSFGYSFRFLPFMLGSGNKVCFVTEAHAERTRRRVLAHLDRLDLRFPVVLALGNSDPITHAANFEKTKDMQRAGLLGSDEEILTAAANRHGALLAEIVERYPGIRLFVLNGYPMIDPEQNGYLPLTSAIVRAWCDRLGLYFCDANDKLRDRNTGLLHKDWLCAPGDDHLSKTATRFVEEKLLSDAKIHGPSRDFEWTSLMRFNLDADVESRLWTEPHLGADNITHSRMIQFGHLAERATAFVCADLHLQSRPGRLLVVNGREGFVPFTMPVGLAAAITSADPSADHVRMGRRIAHFVRRSDITFRQADLGSLSAADRHDDVFAILDATDAPDAQSEQLSRLRTLASRTLFVLSERAWSADALARHADLQPEILPLGESSRSEQWRAANLLVGTTPR